MKNEILHRSKFGLILAQCYPPSHAALVFDHSQIKEESNSVCNAYTNALSKIPYFAGISRPAANISSIKRLKSVAPRTKTALGAQDFLPLIIEY
jgi:hypothetical protein